MEFSRPNGWGNGGKQAAYLAEQSNLKSEKRRDVDAQGAALCPAGPGGKQLVCSRVLAGGNCYKVRAPPCRKSLEYGKKLQVQGRWMFQWPDNNR